MGWPSHEQKLLDLAALKLEVELTEAYATPRSYGWLGEHQDEAAELAALLHEAAPRLVLASLRAPARGARPLPKARSYEISETIRDRLRAAEPMPTGPGEIPWSRLAACISSELLKFDEASDAAAAGAAGPSQAAQPPGSPAAAAPQASPRSPSTPRGGDMLEINSGGRVFFCLFDASTPAPTPPCSRRNSPERHIGRAPPAELGLEEGGEPSSGSWQVLSSESSLLGVAVAASEQRASLLPLQLPAPPHTLATFSGGGDDGTPTPTVSCQLPSGILAGSALESMSLSFCLDSDLTAAAAAGGAAGAAGALSLPPTPAPLRRLVTAAFAGHQTCLVLKFVPSRLLCQSEQFAGELTRHLGLCAPATRILRSKGASEAEWREAAEAAAALRDRFPDLHEELGRNSCCLVMEFVPGSSLFRSPAAFAPGCLAATAADLGRLFTLDMLLGNPDRLRCEELAWRGNTENVLYANAGRWAGRAVAIDAVVQRRPPGGLKSVEDRSCERLTELALNEAGVAATLLRQALQPAQAHGAADLAALPEAQLAAAFQQGLKAALEAAVSIKGLLEMMFERLSEWINEFIADIEEGEGGPPAAAGSQASTPGPAAQPGGGERSGAAGAGGTQPMPTPRLGSGARRVSSAGTAASPLLMAAAAAASTQTMRIRQISHEAQRDHSVGEKVAHWKAVFREKGEELRAAVEEWQAKRGTPAGGQRLTTAFLDGTHPVVDVYELKVRLEHMLQRLRVLQQASLTGRPVRLMPRLFLSGAVEASSLHLLKHLGITHILNATEDLLLPEDDHGFVTMRCPLRDLEEEDLRPLLPGATAFIDEALAGGGGLLVHCHAGRSRSCSLVLAWLMQRRSWPLDRALAFLQRARPEAAPNAGYLKALLGLEEELFGRQTVKMKKTKPEPRRCPECGERVGLSAHSVRVHVKLKHPASALARSMQESGSLGSAPAAVAAAAWAELTGSPGSKGRRSSGGSGGYAASPGSGGASAASSPFSPLLPPSGGAESAAGHAPGPSPLSQQQRQWQHRAAATVAEVEEWQRRVQRQVSGAPPDATATLGPLRVVPSGQAATPGAEGAELPDSPLAMAAAALEAELGGPTLCDGDAREEEEYLSAASTPGQPF